ncbi:hypothetical protein ABEW00_05590 [Rossellomorea vietnamensis]|uniref:hypothetical protein n=1 Tax=Rossellomorea vietnamensis TaxID=218284 RepID=UPI003D2C67C1
MNISILDKRLHVDFHCRQLAFRGAGGEPPRLFLRGLTCPTYPAGVELPSVSINNGYYIYWLRDSAPKVL